MIPLNPLEYQNAVKALYSKCVERVCEEHGITRMELDILLFLANNPIYDTATEMIEIRYLSKSQVSASVRLLEEKGYIRKEYKKGNRKTAHLKICEAAFPVVEHGQAAQEHFMRVMMQGIPEKDIDGMRRCMEQMRKNITRYMKEDSDV